MGGSTEIPVKSAGRETPEADAGAMHAEEDTVGTESETAFPNRRVTKSKLSKCETEKAYLRVVLFTKA